MVSRVHITWVCCSVVLWYKVYKSFWHHAYMKCAPPFSLQGFPTFWITYPCTVVLKTLIHIVNCESFVELLRIYLQLFGQLLSHSLWKKTAIHSLVNFLRSLLLTTCSVIVQTSSKIWQLPLTERPEDHKNRCLSSSTNSVSLHFYEGVDEIK